MVRVYLLQCWFNFSDEAAEDSIHGSYAMRSFMKINFVGEQAPDATTFLKFLHLLEKNNIGKMFFDAVARNLDRHGYMMRGGTVVDATLVSAPRSTKNAQKQCDPEMRQTKKGNQYYLGMKCHVGVDAGSGYVHSLETTQANHHDITANSKLIGEDDDVVYGDSGYLGVERREEIAQDPGLSQVEFRINRRPMQIQKLPEFCYDWEKHIEHFKSFVRSKVEHPFLIVQRLFGYAKVAYRGLAINTHRFHMLFASANLLMWARAGRELPA